MRYHEIKWAKVPPNCGELMLMAVNKKLLVVDAFKSMDGVQK